MRGGGGPADARRTRSRRPHFITHAIAGEHSWTEPRSERTGSRSPLSFLLATALERPHLRNDRLTARRFRVLTPTPPLFSLPSFFQNKGTFFPLFHSDNGRRGTSRSRNPKVQSTKALFSHQNPSEFATSAFCFKDKSHLHKPELLSY